MKSLFLIAAVALAPAMAEAGAADGIWKTASDDRGGYLEVTIAPCASDASMTCGKISKAFTESGEDRGYEHLGKLMIEGMSPDGDNEFSGGTIWNPEDDKTYKSKLIVKGNTLEVDGCVMIFCKEQDWSRVK
jgi:uncharacterized protein (DUF2147 family)